ncbi:uncharacterized protein [Centroberyx affinis]|uniref:uncharacterized protein n=1 Tax=Centroberyx affinis TaxID=166261 RepID=UPI003A5C02C8
MNMQGRALLCSLVLLLALTTVSAVQKLNTINDLKKINFGYSVPKHSLVLLHWFANTVEIDNNDAILLTFEPNSGDYGTHHYGNYERLLDPLPQGHARYRYRYYTLGNLNQATSMELPSHVTERLHNLMEYGERNRDRIIFRVRERNTDNTAACPTIDQVYITQHYESSQRQGTQYDPANTYRITTNLIRQIREFSVGEDERNSLYELREDFGSNTDDSQLRHLRNTWGELACLGLLLFIVIEERLSSNQSRSPASPAYRGQHVARKNTQNHLVVNIPETTPNHWVLDIPETRQNLLLQDSSRLQVITGNNGNARIHWSNVPEHLLNQGVMVVLFKNNEDQETSSIFTSIGDRASGSYDTSVPLNPGLQVRLHKTRRWYCFWTAVGQEMCRGSEFHNPKAEKPVHIRGYDASLQLFVKDGKACARLNMKKTFSHWRSEFKKSWVGFYSSATKATDEYESWKWQWATKFKRCTDLEDVYDNVYEYHSGLTIAPGVQARFILRDVEDIARTPTWT